MDVLVIWVQVENKLIGYFFHDLKDRLWSVRKPDCNIRMGKDELGVINFKATLVNCKKN